MFWYRVYYRLCRMFAWLPFRCLYLISDLMYVQLYYLFRYRRKVVMENLRNSFPEKTDKERRVIARKFYRFFCDLFIETIKLTNIDTAEIRRRICYSNPEIFDELYRKGKQVFVVTGHYGNWEWLATLN